LYSTSNVFGADEASLAHYQFSAALLILGQAKLNQSLHHLPFAGADTFHANSERRNFHPKFGSGLEKGRHLGAIDDVFARQASDIGTGTANQLAFNDGGTFTCFGQRPSRILAGLPAS